MRRTKFKGARVAEISARQSEFEGNLVDFHLLAEPDDIATAGVLWRALRYGLPVVITVCDLPEPDEVELAPEAIGDEG